jgi:transposase
MVYPKEWSALDVAEYQVIKHHLEHYKWNRSHAAKALKVSYKFIMYKIKRYEALGLLVAPNTLNKIPASRKDNLDK